MEKAAADKAAADKAAADNVAADKAALDKAAAEKADSAYSDTSSVTRGGRRRRRRGGRRRTPNGAPRSGAEAVAAEAAEADEANAAEAEEAGEAEAEESSTTAPVKVASVAESMDTVSSDTASSSTAVDTVIATTVSKEAVVDELGQRLSHALNAALSVRPHGPPYAQMASHLRAHASRRGESLPEVVEGAVLRGGELSAYLKRHAVHEVLGALALDLFRDDVALVGDGVSIESVVEFAASRLEVM